MIGIDVRPSPVLNPPSAHDTSLALVTDELVDSESDLKVHKDIDKDSDLTTLADHSKLDPQDGTLMNHTTDDSNNVYYHNCHKESVEQAISTGPLMLL